ncbi:hypothetical protein CA850_30130 [Micromonospora echinospora]|uniref:ABC-2 family transporter protein n=1 Tax=Micromonospora echinospora TaxID=1877 RepID=A0A1C4YUK7_MICEC|nr:ABC transporter permease [Micromonospora echinospora]OZV74589.1 hypothetical protein CA850_30130 [Micromonospora echinospora]SCF24360.1 ABC-2 family transporter protein [Micromonospora echinospora]
MNIVRIGNVTTAELDKLRTLPATTLTAIGAIATGIVIAAALAASAVAQGAQASAVDITLQTVPFAQAGFVLLGILPATHEHAGRQLSTTLTSVPKRGLLVTGKTVAALLVVAVTAAVSIGASLAAATIAQHLTDVPSPADDGEPGLLAGAAAYLTLIGLLSHAVALLVRHLVPALVGTLSLVLIISPALAGVTEHARWLPDRAIAQLYDKTDTALTPVTGALVALAWIVLIGSVAIARFIRHEP